jgi:hypothetical protein
MNEENFSPQRREGAKSRKGRQGLGTKQVTDPLTTAI